MMKRKEILPLWIRFFAWFYLIFILSPVLFVCGLFEFGSSMQYFVFGVTYQGSSLAPLPILILSVLTLASLVSYGILWGRKWAITLGIIYGYVALFMCVYGIILSRSGGESYFPLEPLFLVPFVYILHSKKKDWESFDVIETTGEHETSGAA